MLINMNVSFLKWSVGLVLIFDKNKMLNELTYLICKTILEIFLSFRYRHTIMGSFWSTDWWNNISQIQSSDLTEYWILRWIIIISQHFRSFQVCFNCSYFIITTIYYKNNYLQLKHNNILKIYIIHFYYSYIFFICYIGDSYVASPHP